MENAAVNLDELKMGGGIPVLLELLGYKPLKQAGPELMYKGVLSPGDADPLFVVNKELDVWYDHSVRRGGNIIDFGMAYWNMPFAVVLKKIAEFIKIDGSDYLNPLIRKRRHAIRLPHYRVDEIKPLGNNLNITAYLTSRGIWETAQNTLSEVYYHVTDGKGVCKRFHAVGWQNELGSWEVRNQYFKGSLGHKAITFIGRDAGSLAIFDTCFSYLSWLIDNPCAFDSILIINAPNLLESAMSKAKVFLKISVYFNRSPDGLHRSVEFKRTLPWAVDRSIIYEGYNDYNEMLVKHLSTP
jgi:hypothetical protein